MKSCLSSLLLFLFLLTRPPLDEVACKADPKSKASIEYAHSLLGAKGGSDVDLLLFVPEHNVKKLLLGLIGGEQRAIYAALFCLTDKDIAQALLEAHKRGVKIALVVDKSALESPYEKVSLLTKNKIPLRVFTGKSYIIMHYKLFIFEKTIQNKRLVWYGSANATRTGTTRNEEYVNIRSKREIIDKFQQRFNHLWRLPMVQPASVVKKSRGSLKSQGKIRRKEVALSID